MLHSPIGNNKCRLYDRIYYLHPQLIALQGIALCAVTPHNYGNLGNLMPVQIYRALNKYYLLWVELKVNDML